MEAGAAAGTSARLTARGEKTRSHIVATATDLIRAGGVGGTTLDQVVAASNVSKSQFYRHFDDKAALVRAVIDRIGDHVITRERERLSAVSDFTGLRNWRDALVADNAVEHGRYGCALGSLANEVADHDPAARTELDALFAAWHEQFQNLLRRFQRDGLVPRGADVDRLAIGLLATVQGGYLLAQTSRDVTQMATAIDVAIEHLELLARSTDV